VPAYQVPLIDIDDAVQQVQGLAAAGARAVHIPTFPAEVGLPEYHDARYDPVWSAISEADMSISQHLGLVQSLFDLLQRDPTPQKAIFTSQPAMRLAETIGFWILPGVLARFPKLKIVLVEPSLGWVPFYLDTLDSMAAGPYDFPELDDKPSAYFHRQMHLTFVDDPRGLLLRHELGVDRIMWSTDFPHPATSWPNSQAVVEKNFAGIPDDERDLIVAGNAARVYGF
jgi:predicted TIM-barrel fold metal-dependent hydrolase